MQDSLNNDVMTIDDVAKALGISTTTVSRSLSGKGRISEATRQKVLDFVKKSNYKPNPIAKGLAKQKTYNIAWVVPADTDMNSLQFFQRCLIGVLEKATARDYDVLITATSGDDISGLVRVIDNRKADGVILAQTMLKDNNIKLLKESGIPFVVVGSTDEEDVVQIDNDHDKACRELVSILVMKGNKELAYLGDSADKIVSITRKRGFEAGAEGAKVQIYMDNTNSEKTDAAVDEILRKGADCIVCEDDRICQDVLLKLSRENVKIPGDIKVASFYNSKILENNQPPVTSLHYDPKELGAVACTTLLDLIKGREVQHKQILGYEVLLKASTQ